MTATTSDIPSAVGRCSSCRYVRAYELPLRSIHHCIALRREMSSEQRDAVRDCSSWDAFRPLVTARRRRAAEVSEITRDLMHAEGKLFGAVSACLRRQGVSLKTLMLLAQPNIPDISDLSWLDDVAVDTPSRPLSELILELRALRYDALAELVEVFARREEVAA